MMSVTKNGVSTSSPPSVIPKTPLSQTLSTDVHEQEREKIFCHAIEAIKQCQTAFGGKSQLAADTDTTVSILLLRLERVFQHGLRQNFSKSVIDGAFRQFTELSGLNLNHIKPDIGTDIVFWTFIKHFLNKDELSRFLALKNVTSDFARGRAWIRAALNEHNLDKYVSMILADSDLTKQFYEPHAFLLDSEKAGTLPQMISSLRNIYFALKIDNSDLELGRNMSNMSDFALSKEPSLDPLGDNRPPIAPRQEALMLRSDSSDSSEKRRKRQKKKKLARIEEMSRNVPARSHFLLENSSTQSQSTDEVFESLDPFQSTESAPPDLIPIFEKLEINYPGSKRSMSSQNSENSNQEGSFATGNSESLEMLEDSAADYVEGSEMGAFGGLSFDFSGESESAKPARRPGHYRSQSDNAARLKSIKSELNQLGVVGGSGCSARSTTAAAAVGTRTTAGAGGVGGALSVEEMRQAVVDMMRRKDVFERENHALHEQLREERERGEETRRERDEAQESESVLRREVEVLKGQLKRYVSAVNTLNRDRKATVKQTLSQEEGGQGQGHVDQSPLEGLEGTSASGSRSESVVEDSEASVYESKLIAMSGLHAELLELNEQLQNDVINKDRTIHHLRNEINVLRGPLPGNEFLTVEDLAAMFVNVWIPSSFQRHSHQIYHVHVRVKNEEWRIFKRYQQFHDLHISLKKEYPAVDSFEFPPKTLMGNKDAKFIEERKRALQIYLQKTTNYLVRQHSRIRTHLSKEVLINFLPFFSPVHNAFTVNG